MQPVSIRRALPADFGAAARLLASCLRFSAADAVPAWFMRTTDECGGLTLVAVADGDVAGDERGGLTPVAVSDGRVVGVSYAVAGRDGGEPFLFSCGLAVAHAQRGRRLGLELKLVQRREAIALGYARVRWTTDPVNGRALRVYLSGLGARVVGYRPGLHDGLRADPGHPQDDLDVVWHLDGAPALDTAGARAVELPWAAGALEERDRVRRQMRALLADGYVGAGVELDRDARRCRVTFAQELR